VGVLATNSPGLLLGVVGLKSGLVDGPFGVLPLERGAGDDMLIDTYKTRLN
jgi:hypothetical protein